MNAPTRAESTTQYPKPGPPERTRARVRDPLPSDVDVAIVGCGLGGLTTAAYLAKAGLRVACFDGHTVAGGCATVFGRGSGASRYTFDVGLHYIGDCGPEGTIPTMLRTLGTHVDFLKMDENGFDTFVFPDFEFAVPSDIGLYRDRLVAQFPKEQKGIDRYVRLVRAVSELAALTNDNDGRITPKLLWRVLTRHRIVIPHQNSTIAAFLDTCTNNQQLRAIMLGQHGDYAMPPSKVSAMLHTGLAAHYFRGAYYPKGGGQIISDTLCEVIEGAGGSIHLNRPIAKILIEGGRAVGVQTVDERNRPAQTIRAKTVVSNADLTRTLTELVGTEHLPGRWKKQLPTYEMAGALFITCLGVNIPPAELAKPANGGMGARNYWVFDGYDFESMYADAASSESLKTTGAYITSASFKDPENPHHAPDGITNIEVMSIVPGTPDKWGLTAEEAADWKYKRHGEYAAIKSRVENHLIDRLERRFPGTRDAIVYRESATPITHSRYTGALAGTSYGLAATPAQFGPKRPGAGPVLDGLYLCGASMRTGHGIVGAMLSGRLAAKSVLKRKAARS